VVDDHVDAAMSLAMLLSICGHTVETAHTGADALRLAPQFRPRLAVLDIGLPGMNGYELAAKLLELPEMRNTTLIAMTGYGQSKDQRRSAAAGFHHHLVKPVEPAALQAIIDALDEARIA
jgi:CheY-like chemotaxis protein